MPTFPIPRFLPLAAATLAMTASAMTLGATEAAAAGHDDYKLTILHINDLHSRIEPITKYDGTCGAEDDAEGKCFGGVARIKTYLDQRQRALRTLGANVITLDAGDQFQGSLFYSTYKGKAAAEFMNEMGFDVMAVGNHEFDDGPQALADFIDLVDFPVISGNTSTYSEPLLKKRIERYKILTVGGRKIGVVSVLATDTAETASPGPNIAFSDEIRYLNSVIPEVEDAGADIIIALTHVGLNKDIEIAKSVPGLDVIVGGHSHTYLSASDPKRKGAYPTWVSNEETGDLVPIVQAYAYSKYVGELTIDFDDKGRVLYAEGDTAVMDASVKPNAEMAARVAELAAPIEDLKKTPVGSTTADIDGDRSNCRAHECTMGVLVAEAMLDRVKDQGVTIAIQNGGGVRASIPAGDITMGDVLTVLPFQNTVATFQLTGEGVIKALENGVSQVEDLKGRFPQIAGMRFAWNPANAPGGRVTQVQVRGSDGWVDIDRKATYGVVSNDYMRSGGDGYAVFADEGQNAYDYGPGLEQVVADYIKANSPYTPKLNGAILEGAAFAVPEAAQEEAAAEAEVEATSEVEETTEAAPSTGGVYVVKSGDNLWDIAKATLGDATRWTEIAALNGLTKGSVLALGQELKLP